MSVTRTTHCASPCETCIFEKQHFPKKKKTEMTRRAQCTATRKTCNPSPCDICIFVLKKIFFAKKIKRRRDAPNVRPLARPATLHLVTYVFFTKKYFLDFFEKNLFVCKKKNREDETRLMYGHSDDLQRFTLLSWAALKVPDRIFPLLARLPARGSEAEQTGERERGRGRERERESARV